MYCVREDERSEKGKIYVESRGGNFAIEPTGDSVAPGYDAVLHRQRIRRMEVVAA